jgi:hypothetical protein
MDIFWINYILGNAILLFDSAENNFLLKRKTNINSIDSHQFQQFSSMCDKVCDKTVLTNEFHRKITLNITL